VALPIPTRPSSVKNAHLIPQISSYPSSSSSAATCISAQQATSKILQPSPEPAAATLSAVGAQETSPLKVDAAWRRPQGPPRSLATGETRGKGAEEMFELRLRGRISCRALSVRSFTLRLMILFPFGNVVDFDGALARGLFAAQNRQTHSRPTKSRSATTAARAAGMAKPGAWAYSRSSMCRFDPLTSVSACIRLP